MAVNLDGLAKAAEALSAPLTKLIEVAGGGLGALGGPPLLVLRGHREGKAALIRPGCDQKLRRLEARHADELRALPTTEPRQLAAPGELSADEIGIIFRGRCSGTLATSLCGGPSLRRSKRDARKGSE